MNMNEQTSLKVGNDFLQKEANSQIDSQKLLNSFEIHLFDLNKEVGKQKYNLYEAENNIEGQEKKLKQNIQSFKTNLNIQMENIRLKIQTAQKMEEICDRKIYELMEIKKTNLIKLQDLKNKILELQEIEISKNRYCIQLDQNKIEDFKQEKINSTIEKTKDKIQQYTSKINEIDENIQLTKKKTSKIDQKITNIHKNKQSFLSIINKLSREVATQTPSNSKNNQNIDISEFSKYNNIILHLRNLQLSYLSKVSSLYSKNLLIESKLSNITQKIQTYRFAPKVSSLNSNCDKQSNDAFIKLHQKYLKRTELTSENIENLFTSLQNDIKLTRKEKKAYIKEIAIIKDQIFKSNQNENSLANHLNEIEQKIKNTVKSTEKMTKLMDYYDECSNVNPITFTFSKEELDKIRKSAYKLAKTNVNQETELINQIKQYKNESKQLIFQISSQRLKNQNLRKKVEEMYNNPNT